MNVFKLDESPEVAASYHCDRHLVKMPIEYAQMLCTAIRLQYGKPGEVLLPDPFRPGHRVLTAYPHVLPDEDGKPPRIYLTSHQFHPCSVWARESRTNWLWLKLLALNVGLEYARVYGRVHASTSLIMDLDPPDSKRNHLDEVPVVVPDDCVMSTAVESYREYYRTHKNQIATYTRRERPFWMN